MRVIQGTQTGQASKLYLEVGNHLFSVATNELPRHGRWLEKVWRPQCPSLYGTEPEGKHDFRAFRPFGRSRWFCIEWRRGYYAASIKVWFTWQSKLTIVFPMPARADWKAKCAKWARGEFIGQVGTSA